MTGELMTTFFTYEDWTLEEEPRCFYVGKGKEARVDLIERNQHHINIAQKYGMCRVVVFASSVEDLAFDREVELIAEHKTYVYGDDYVFGANYTRGGEGKQYTYKQRQTHSERQKQWSNTPEARARNSTAQQRDDVRERKRAANKARWKTDEELRRKTLKRTQSPENVEFHSKRQSAAWQDPVQRAKMLDGMHRPDVVAKRRVRTSYEGNSNAKLTWALVDEIRSMYDDGAKMLELQTKCPLISYSTLRRVVTRRTWVMP